MKHKGLGRLLYSLLFIPLEDREIEGKKNPLEAGVIKTVLWKSFTGFRLNMGGEKTGMKSASSLQLVIRYKYAQ